MTGDERTIRNYEKLRDMNYRLNDLFSELSGFQLYRLANAVSVASGGVMRERDRLHPEYIEAKNRQSKEA